LFILGLENKLQQGSRWTRLQSMAIITTPHASERCILRSDVQDCPITTPSEIARASGSSASLVLAVPAARVAESPVANQLVLPASHNHLEIATPLGGVAKRAVDVAFALAAFILLSPLMLTIMGLVKMTMGGSIFFAHMRVGYGGRQFHCYKFRTMVADGEEILARHLAGDPQAAQEWRETRKLRNDPRVTFFGRLLRKSSLDELPQLINILRGEMSCVGPRPIVAHELQRYGAHAAEYLRARPGLTGIWQVSGRSTLDYADRVALDCHYVRNWSVWADLAIMGKTVFAVMKFDEAA
jgi:exopolysaccharide production protein ExoY